MKFEQTYPRNFVLRECVQLLGDSLCPMYGIINMGTAHVIREVIVCLLALEGGKLDIAMKINECTCGS